MAHTDVSATMRRYRQQVYGVSSIKKVSSK
ncbi:UNVERIFIED_CONTAM: hypothetical protein [Bacteriophage sp.]